MKLAQQFEQHLKHSHLISPGQRLLVAVSAGSDSMALLTLLARLKDKWQLEIGVAHVNHHLRAQSDLEAKTLKAYCQQLAIPFFQADWQIEDHPTNGVEAAAREFRYHFFARLMPDYDRLVTAHHGDDQLETVLMRLGRSGEIHEMQGIKPQREFAGKLLIRPLLPFQKQELTDFARKEQIPFFEDETNHDQHYLRNFYRQTIIPAIKERQPEIVSHTNRFTTQLQGLLSFAEAGIKAKMDALSLVEKSGSVTGSLKPFLDLPEAGQQLLLSAIIKRLPNSSWPTTKQQVAILSLINSKDRPNGYVELTNDQVFQRRYDAFVYGKVATKPKSEFDQTSSLDLQEGQWQDVGAFQIMYRRSTDDENELSKNQFIIWGNEASSFALRHWQAGDQIQLKSDQHKKLRRFWIDRKVPEFERKNWWIVASEQNIVLIPNMPTEQLSHRTETDKIKYVITIK